MSRFLRFTLYSKTCARTRNAHLLSLLIFCKSSSYENARRLANKQSIWRECQGNSSENIKKRKEAGNVCSSSKALKVLPAIFVAHRNFVYFNCTKDPSSDEYCE